ncbi:MAG: Rieske 2Fe-2S domain-containing protein [Armatimonadota bacterium]
MRDSSGGEEPQCSEIQDLGKRRLLSFFSGVLSLIIAAAVGIPLVGLFLAPVFVKRRVLWLPLGKVSDVPKEQPCKFTYSYIKQDGWFEKTVYGTAYAIHSKSGELTVLSNICTHLGCGVRWDPEKSAFVCPCHNGVYSYDGSVMSGPPPKPLPRFACKVSSGQIEILIEGA